jgi:hypothetical protein
LTDGNRHHLPTALGEAMSTIRHFESAQVDALDLFRLTDEELGRRWGGRVVLAGKNLATVAEIRAALLDEIALGNVMLPASVVVYGDARRLVVECCRRKQP